MKKFFKIQICFFYIFLILLILTGCSNLVNEKNNLNKKIKTEIFYLDTELVSLINELNNINYQKYKVEIQEVENIEKDSDESKSEGESNKESGEKKNTKESKEVTEISLQPDNILGKEESVNWKEIKGKIENLYTAWTTISLDLKEIGVANDNLTKFATNMDLAAVAVKNEDKSRRNILFN